MIKQLINTEWWYNFEIGLKSLNNQILLFLVLQVVFEWDQRIKFVTFNLYITTSLIKNGCSKTRQVVRVN